MSHLEAEIGSLERESRQLTDLFHCIVNDMKGSTVVWEDFSTKAAKLHVALRSTIVVITPFLDAFQKVADLANGSRGATKDIGVALTRLCVRHRSIDTKLRAFAAAITDTVVEPLQMRLEEWKKTATQMDRDHSKEYKKIQNEIKKASSDSIRLQKRVKKGQSDLKLRIDNALLDVHKKYVELEDAERRAVRSAMIEERSRFCSFLSFLKPLMEQEIGMFGEFSHLQEIVELLLEQTADPASLPQSCEQVILDIKNGRGADVSTLKSSSSGCVMTLGLQVGQVGSYRSSTCSIDSSSSGYSQSQGSSHISNSQSTTALAQPSSVDLNGKDDSSSSEFSSLSLAGSHSTASLHSSSTFHPFPSTPLDSSEFLRRSHTISYGHLNVRPFFSAFESKNDAAVVTSIAPSDSTENGNPGNGMTQSAEATDRRTEEEDVCAQSLIDSCQEQGHVIWPAVPSFLSTKQRVMSSEESVSVEKVNSGDVGRVDLSLGRPVCRSFSFPTQIESLENLDSSNSVRPTTSGFQLPQQNISHGFSVQSDVAEACNDETKSMTLPRMPQFKVPLLVPQRFSSNMSGRGRPPTLPKRTSSRLCSFRPSFPSAAAAADAARAGSAEELPSTAPVKLNSCDLQSNRDTTDNETMAGGQIGRCHTTDVNEENQFSASSPGFSPLRQQAPPSDDADGFCLVSAQRPAVIPLTEEIAEFSGCQMQCPVDDNGVTKPEDFPGENSVK